MKFLPSSILLVLSAFPFASCASVPAPATKAPDSPASASAVESRFEKLELFAPAEAGHSPATEASPADAAMPGMDHSKMEHSMHAAKPPVPDLSADVYTCVMHPQIEEAKPGKCPICGMALVKKPKEKK